MLHSRMLAAALLPFALACCPLTPACADDDPTTPAPTPDSADSSGYGTDLTSYLENWFARSDAAKASQPHWMTPMITVTPRLEQEYRYDQYWQHLGNGANISQYDSGKALELIPTYTEEVLINPPPYLVRTARNPASGWGDWPFLVVKQRLASGNEQNGNYIVTVFMGVQAPTGITQFTNRAWIVTPTLAGGKGWGDFDFQTTLSAGLPTAEQNFLGTALLWNTTLQYHFLTYFWPEFTTSLTHWYGGLRDDKTQLMLAPGIIFGRFPLYGRTLFSIGGAYQFATTPKLSGTPVLTPIYNHAWILSGRVSF